MVRGWAKLLSVQRINMDIYRRKMWSFYIRFSFTSGSRIELKMKSFNCYRDRWTVESAFGSFKSLFGEHVSAKSFRNRSKEVKIKFGILNMLLVVP